MPLLKELLCFLTFAAMLLLSYVLTRSDAIAKSYRWRMHQYSSRMIDLEIRIKELERENVQLRGQASAQADPAATTKYSLKRST